MINPAQPQSIKLTKNLSHGDRDAIWDEVVRQVTKQGCGLGHYASTPPVLDHAAVTDLLHGPPQPIEETVTLS